MQGQEKKSNQYHDQTYVVRFFYVFRLCLVLAFSLSTCFIFLIKTPLAADLNLQDLIDEALRNNPEIHASQWKLSASRFRISQVQSLPDPMFMFGYQNEGTKSLYTFGNEMAPDSQWMFSVSQMLPFPGKLSLKAEMATRDFESLQARHESLKLRIISKVKELYFSLFLAYKNIELIDEQKALFSKIEDTAMSRYKTGAGSLQDLLMAQTEKYMLLEKKEMLLQRIQSIEAMLIYILGRDVNTLIGKPLISGATSFNYELNQLLEIASANSPSVSAIEKMLAGSHVRMEMSHKEYYPDFTLTASYFARSKLFPDMWSVATTVNIPLFYKTKQQQAVNESMAMVREAENELQATKLMIYSSIRDSYSMLKTSERLMELYKSGIIPRLHQDVELSIAAYTAGKSDVQAVLSKIKNIIDVEILYWSQFVEREKAIAKLEELIAYKIPASHHAERSEEGKRQ